MDFESNRRRDSGTANNIMYHFGRLNSKLNKANKDQLEKSSVAKAYPTGSSLYLLSASFLKVNHRVASVSSLCSAADVSSLKLVSTNEQISQIHKYNYSNTGSLQLPNNGSQGTIKTVESNIFLLFFLHIFLLNPRKPSMCLLFRFRFTVKFVITGLMCV